MKRLSEAYYGWRVVGALAITQLVSWGVLYYAFGVLLLPMQIDTGWDVGTLSGAFSLSLAISGLAALPVGRLLDRIGPRLIMSFGSVISVLLVMAWSTVRAPIDLYLVWVFIGAAMACVLYEPAFAVVSHWFQKRRSQALTVVTIGGGLASVVFVPLTNAFVEAGGWRTALMALASILALVTIPLHVLVLRRRMDGLGSHMDIEFAQADVGSVSRVPQSLPLREAIRTGAFWWLALAFTCLSFGALAISVYLIALLSERGVDAAFAALILSMVGGSQIPGRLLFALLSARFSTLTLGRGMFALSAVGMMLLLVARDPLHLYVFAVLFGAGMGTISPVRAALMAERFGSLHYGSIMGMQSLVTALVRSAAPAAVGILVTAAGSYEPVLPLILTLNGAALLALWMVSDNAHSL